MTNINHLKLTAFSYGMSIFKLKSKRTFQSILKIIVTLNYLGIDKFFNDYSILFILIDKLKSDTA